jgi:hypothetical protein
MCREKCRANAIQKLDFSGLKLPVLEPPRLHGCAAALFTLIFLDRNAMISRISVVANACHLPEYFHAGFAARYFKND